MPIVESNKLRGSYFLGVWKICENSGYFLDKIILSDFEKRTYDSFKIESRKVQWLSCRLLVDFFLKENRLKGNIEYNSNGSPYLTCGYNISMSHTPQFSAVVIAKNKPVGIDIERVSERIVKVKDRFLSEEEKKECKTDLEKMTLVWAAKEAVYKMYNIYNLNFKDEIYVNLLETSDALSVRVKHPELNTEFFLRRKKIEDHILVYVGNL